MKGGYVMPKYKVQFFTGDSYYDDGELVNLPAVGDTISLTSSSGREYDEIPLKVVQVIRHYHNHKGDVTDEFKAEVHLAVYPLPEDEKELQPSY
jgi:hypothetical protein